MGKGRRVQDFDDEFDLSELKATAKPKPLVVMMLSIGGVETGVAGGPFMDWAGRGIGICMAREFLNLPATRHVPVTDFQVPGAPESGLLRDALQLAIDGMLGSAPVYVGCMGGVGRTGLFLALLAKIAGEADPVGYVRANYNPHAVETWAQLAFVGSYDVRRLRRYARLQGWLRRYFGP